MTRDLGLYLVGLGGIIYVTLKGGPERPSLYVLLAACVGLPTILRSDEKRKDQRSGSDVPVSPDGGTP